MELTACSPPIFVKARAGSAPIRAAAYFHVRDLDMIDNTINSVFEQFSKKFEFEYNTEPLPYRPYGEVRGILKNNPFKIYIYQPESQASRGFITVFTIPSIDQLPRGFCIEHIGGPNIGNKSFDELIQIRSYDLKIVTNYLNDDAKSFLVETFLELDKLETSQFKTRSFFRISDSEITLSMRKLFKDVDELNTAFSLVINLLVSVKGKITDLAKL